MNKTIITLAAISILIIGCNTDKKQNPFLINKQSIGWLTDSTQVKDLALAFPNDSIVKGYLKGDEFTGQNSDIEIYSTAGERLLSLTPSQMLDSTSVIESIQVRSASYRTEQQISNKSTFKEIKDAYKISSINNLINSIVISVNDINASFTIDKKELPANLRYDMTLKIDAVQIPDNAKIKYFIIHW